MAHVLNSPPNGTPYSSRPRTATVSSYQVKADRLTLDPEDVFSKHTIAEVKAILIQLQYAIYIFYVNLSFSRFLQC